MVTRLNGAIRNALASQDVFDGLASLYLEPLPTSPAQLAGMLKADTALWVPLVKAVGFTPEG